ncbi:mannitol dehydrogenase family protein [Massilia sp. PWRC2]|uniref:mannitol dehydrogenase family protein n=1 Tax=Massilia sp. PWRC2 TaxID=2804626 RepID=UPI003CF00547
MAAAVNLNQATLAQLPLAVAGPRYRRARVAHSIVHIGVGGFFRAHQALYLDRLLHLPGNEPWGYCGIGLLPQDAAMVAAMAAQDCLYTVIERSAQGDVARVVGALLDVMHAPADPEAVLEKLADGGTRIVSLTITEGGYYVNQGNGQFDASHPDIVHDLAHPQTPRCSFGYLIEALQRRRKRGLAPFTVLSCDNLQHNGDLARAMLLAFAQLRDGALADWLAQHGAFPNSMVDRITPATTDAHRALLRQRFGLNDAWPVVTESFSQWVIEDHFPGGRPAWELVGAQMTADVAPYEKMKLRLLNGGHQALCYLGMLLGYQYAHEAMADVAIARLFVDMMDIEVTPLLSPVAGIDLAAYKRTLVERCANAAIGDQLARIGTEGSARIPKFVLPSIREQLARGGPIERLCFTVACWCRYLEGHSDQGAELPLSDPYAQQLRAAALRGGADAGALLSLQHLFGDLAAQPRFVAQVSAALARLYGDGARAALQHVLQAG